MKTFPLRYALPLAFFFALCASCGEIPAPKEAKPEAFAVLKLAMNICNDTLAAGQTVRKTMNITLPSVPPKADVMFASDLTSSMVDEVAKAKTNSTSIMNQITNLIPDTWFGAMSFKDYAKSFKYCNYQTSSGGPVLYGSGSDYPYKLDQKITVTKSSVSSAINTWTISTDPNTDYPASYTRALWEMYNDTNVGWRSGSKRFIVLFGDALPHDCQFTVNPYTVNTGPDPGRDATAGTSDDLGWDATTTGLKNNNISLITLYSGDAKLKLGGGPPLQIFKFWEFHSQKTGGDAFQLNKQGGLPNNANIANFIQSKVQSLSATISSLTIELCKDQSSTYAGWLSNPDTKTNVTSGTGPHNMGISVTPPGGTSPGSYSFEICIYGDGVEYARQTCAITVSGCSLPGLGDPCSVGVGACRRTGTKQCNAAGTALVCSATAGSPSPETCDNIDNDCDGTTDETWTNKGTACTVGTGQCQRNGSYVCNSTGTHTVCSVSPGNPIAELCNGLDDDCDGSIDETFPQKGQPCTVGVGECRRNGVQQCNSSGSGLQCSASPGSPVSERCDGLDNDCDGSVDENFSQKNQPCTVGAGECRRTGTNVCNSSGSGLQCSVSPGSPTTERCDGLDNDCDGSVDENFSQKGRPCTVGVGECRRTGTNVCNPSGSGLRCSVSPGSPTTERCDGLDNDCDGSVDETFTNKGQSCSAGTGPCRRTGVYVCNSSGTHTVCNAQAATPTAERCDGIDNDCDGSVDENYPDKGKACTSGVGECRRAGTYRCRSNGSGVECSATPGAPSTETCDTKDNDCDGQIDEGCNCTPGTSRPCYSGPSGSAGKGPCKQGTQTCVAGQWGTCNGQVLPATELCDGIDNDCDGTTDEDFPSKGQSCTAGAGLCQNTGSFRCNAAKTGVECSVQARPGAAERCDGQDNDCDGKTDEDFAQLGQSCSAGQSTCQGTGRFVCKADGSGTECNAKAGTPSAEVCDNIDNDCDGQVDELVSRSCYTGPAGTSGKGPCKAGTQTCTKGVWSACAGQVVPGAEICDNKDNDCDGSVDENLTQPCATACAKGVKICKAGAFGACNAAQPQPEVCDNKDNDCDGAVDNGLSRACKSACGQGQESCKAGKWQACSAPKPSAEVCDGKDNDCDGSVDEDIPPKRCQGACGSGTALCESGQFVGCTGLTPKPEVCDGIDNDCNGKVDDVDPRVCRSECGEGKEKCVQGFWKDCDAPKPEKEACDGVDNDCDGFVDNSAPCPTGEGCYKGKCTPTCTEDKDCGKGSQCAEGFCAGDPCKDVQCPDDKRCVGGHCVDACALVTCDEGKVCRDGKCRENSCYGLGCPGGQVCKGGKCEPDPCLTANCSRDEACRDGKCVASCAWVRCDLGKRCEDGTCVDDPCQTKTCQGGQICVKDKCVDDPCAAITCDEGRLCDPATKKCVDDPCLTLQCPAGQVCKKGQCSPTAGAEPPPSASGEEPLGDLPPTTNTGGDAGNSSDGPGTKPPGSCGCTSTPEERGIPLFPMFAFLGLLLLRRRPLN